MQTGHTPVEKWRRNITCSISVASRSAEVILTTSTQAHWRKTVFMRCMRKVVLFKWQFDGTQANAHCRKTVRVKCL